MMILRAEAELLRSAWLWALHDVAKKLDTDSNRMGTSKHPVVRILGPVAWGRFEYETGACDTKDRVMMGVGYLEGLRDGALRAARELKDAKADRLLCDVPGLVRKRVYG